MQLDRTDGRILAALQRDGRTSLVDLAEQVGLSATPCARRVKRLEDAGVIEGYTARIDPRRVGHSVQAFVQVKLERHTDETAERFRRGLEELPEVAAAYAMTGEMDFLLEVFVPDIEALGRFTLHRLMRLPGVRDVRSSLVLETLKRGAGVPVEHLVAR
ncbi:MAG: Lrp/AsnC family transcriptional regulator [Steroidobacteraceae bacterium]|nr:Lrp/AsnC family transcriptional regulator [Steroidobacteraceae bacterium]